MCGCVLCGFLRQTLLKFGSAFFTSTVFHYFNFHSHGYDGGGLSNIFFSLFFRHFQMKPFQHNSCLNKKLKALSSVEVEKYKQNKKTYINETTPNKMRNFKPALLNLYRLLLTKRFDWEEIKCGAKWIGFVGFNWNIVSIYLIVLYKMEEFGGVLDHIQEKMIIFFETLFRTKTKEKNFKCIKYTLNLLKNLYLLNHVYRKQKLGWPHVCSRYHACIIHNILLMRSRSHFIFLLSFSQTFS